MSIKKLTSKHLKYLVNLGFLLIVKLDKEFFLMNLETKLKKWELHNKKLIAYDEDPITFGQWDIGYCGAVTDHLSEEQNKQETVKKHVKNFSEIAELIRSFGGFYFSCYKNLLKLKLDKQYIFRFVYLCTLMNYENKIEFGSAKGDNVLALEKDLQEILKLSKRETINTKKELIKNKLIIINDDKTISINNKYAVKGDIDKRKLKGSVRAMEQGIQELYNKAKATEHKKLGLFIEILPYVNFTHNVLCKNPTETDINKVEAITLYELSKMFKTNQTRLKRDLFDITVNDEYAIGIFSKKNGMHIYVNPRIYYKGNNVADLKGLMNMFRIQ